jgi:hypothetical protein
MRKLDVKRCFSLTVVKANQLVPNIGEILGRYGKSILIVEFVMVKNGANSAAYFSLSAIFSLYSYPYTSIVGLCSVYGVGKASDSWPVIVQNFNSASGVSTFKSVPSFFIK